MILDDEQKKEAGELLLTETEYSIALAIGITPLTYARHRQDILREREAQQRAEELGNDAMLARAAFFDFGRGEKPPQPEE